MMGLFDIFAVKPAAPAKKERKPKSPPKSGAERLALEEAQFLALTRKREYELYRDVMLTRMGVKPKPEKDKIKEIVTTISELRAAGLIQDPTKAGDSGFMGEIVKALPALITGFGGFVEQQQQIARLAQAQMVNQGQATGQLAEPRQQTESASAAVAATTSIPVPAEEQVSPASAYLIANLKDKSSYEAAMWLNNHPDENMQKFVALIRQTPDEEFATLVAQIAAANPELAAFSRWTQTRWQWTLEAIRELKGMAQAAPKAGGKSRFGFHYGT